MLCDLLASIAQVPIVAISIDFEGCLLVYPFFAAGSLEDCLASCSGDRRTSGRDSLSNQFSWDVRLKAATGLLRALEYLHGGCSRMSSDGSSSSCIVLHRNVKPSKVFFLFNVSELVL